MRVSSAGPRPSVRRFDWEEARRLHAEGMSYYAIAKRVGVSPQSVRLACDDSARERERFRTENEVELVATIERIAGFFEFAPDGCWHWTGSRFNNGYGAFWDGRRNVRAHRAMYELVVGPIPAGLALDHLCRVRHCVNPSHLEPVTTAENCRRAAVNPAATHCPRSHHELTPENTRVEANGYRRCRTCERDRARERRRGPDPRPGGLCVA